MSAGMRWESYEFKIVCMPSYITSVVDMYPQPFHVKASKKVKASYGDPAKNFSKV